MGFDVVYVMLVYFIGMMNCKGCNNIFDLCLDDLGLLYVIGFFVGGYDVIEFSFGIFDDWDVFVVEVYWFGLEVVFDLVL